MHKDYSIRLTDRTETVEYRERNCVYRFDVGKRGKTWIIYLPPLPEMSTHDADRILERIKSYLSKRWWFWIFPVSYAVTVEQKVP